MIKALRKLKLQLFDPDTYAEVNQGRNPKHADCVDFFDVVPGARLTQIYTHLKPINNTDVVITSYPTKRKFGWWVECDGRGGSGFYLEDLGILPYPKGWHNTNYTVVTA